MKEYEYVNHPSHYNKPNRKECIEEMIDKFGKRKTINWCEMTVFKYEYRLGDKPTDSLEQDKAKIEWYKNKAKELRGKTWLGLIKNGLKKIKRLGCKEE